LGVLQSAAFLAPLVHAPDVAGLAAATGEAG